MTKGGKSKLVLGALSRGLRASGGEWPRVSGNETQSIVASARLGTAGINEPNVTDSKDRLLVDDLVNAACRRFVTVHRELVERTRVELKRLECRRADPAESFRQDE